MWCPLCWPWDMIDPQSRRWSVPAALHGLYSVTESVREQFQTGTHTHTHTKIYLQVQASCWLEDYAGVGVARQAVEIHMALVIGVEA